MQQKKVKQSLSHFLMDCSTFVFILFLAQKTQCGLVPHITSLNLSIPVLLSIFIIICLSPLTILLSYFNLNVNKNRALAYTNTLFKRSYYMKTLHLACLSRFEQLLIVLETIVLPLH